MARKVAPKQHRSESATLTDDSLSTDMARFVTDMSRLIESSISNKGDFTVDDLLQRNRIDRSDRETARTLRRCGKKISIN